MHTEDRVKIFRSVWLAGCRIQVSHSTSYFESPRVFRGDNYHVVVTIADQNPIGMLDDFWEHVLDWIERYITFTFRA